jgi:hypothetical protein
MSRIKLSHEDHKRICGMSENSPGAASYLKLGKAAFCLQGIDYGMRNYDAPINVIVEVVRKEADYIIACLN